MFVCVCGWVSGCEYHIFIHSSVGRHLDCFHVLAVVSNTEVNMGVQLSFEILVSFPLYIHPEVGLLDHMVVVFLIFVGTSMLFSIVAESIYIPTNSYVSMIELLVMRLNLIPSPCPLPGVWEVGLVTNPLL